jgi:hypothetical protein
MSGSSSLVEYYRDQFDQGVDVNVMLCKDVHAVAGLLKLYLRELPEPLFPYEFYTDVLETHSKDTDQQQKVQRLKEIVTRLPEENQIILRYLCGFLARVVEFSSVNKMNKQNLGIIFGPNLLRKKNQDPTQALADSTVINGILLESEQLQSLLHRHYKDIDRGASYFISTGPNQTTNSSSYCETIKSQKNDNDVA